MGMYTELLLKANLKSKLPEEVKDALTYMFTVSDTPFDVKRIDHPFFREVNLDYFSNSNSFYHHPAAIHSYVDDYLFIRVDLKNYDFEIEKFLSWFTPYLNELKGTCYGWTWYEEEEEPTLLIA